MTLSQAVEATPKTMPSPADIYLRTHEALKKEIAASVKDARGAERSTLLIAGAIYAFLAARCPVQVPPFFWYIPALLTLFGALRVAALMISIRPRAQYLRLLETTVLAESPIPAWEVFFRKHYRLGVGLSMWVFWLGLAVATLWIPDHLPDPLCMSSSATK
jgi:hypothetical protein